MLNPSNPEIGVSDTGDLPMSSEGGSNVREMNLYFRVIVPVLQELHGISDGVFWRMVLYWYVTDRIKSKGYLDGVHAIPYDHVVHKEMFRGYKKERLRRNALDSIVDIAKIVHKRQRHRFPAAVVYSTARYVAFKSFHWRKGRRKRKTLEAIANRQPDRSFKFALLHVPTVLIEDFDFYVALQIDLEDPVDTRKIKNGFAVAYASRRLKGRKTRLMQHGAKYGELRDHAGTCIESRLPDEYFTWGWKYNKNHVPGRAYRLERFAREYTRHGGDLVENRILIALPVNFKAGFEEKFSRFLSLLRDKRLTGSWEFTIRKKPIGGAAGKSNGGDDGTAGLVAPDLFMDAGESTAKALAGARLVVLLDHPSTMFLEAIHVDKPIVALASGLEEYRQEYLPHVQFLLESGMLHETVENLVFQLGDILEEPEKWWNGVKSREGYAEYKSKYCGWGQKRPLG